MGEGRRGEFLVLCSWLFVTGGWLFDGDSGWGHRTYQGKCVWLLAAIEQKGRILTNSATERLGLMTSGLDGGDEVGGWGMRLCGRAFVAQGSARAMLFAEGLAIAEEFAAGLGGGGLFEELFEDGGQCGRGELRFGEQFLDVELAFGDECAGLKGGDLFAEVKEFLVEGGELRVEAQGFGSGFGLKLGDPRPWTHSRGERGGRGVAMVFAEGLGSGWVDDGVDADDIADRFDRGAVGRALGQDDMGHADAGEVGVGEGEECSAGFGVEDADVTADATVFEAGIDDVADEVAGAAIARLEAVGSVVEEDRLLVVERGSLSQGGLGIAVAVLRVGPGEGDVTDQSSLGVDGEAAAPVGEVFGESVGVHRSVPVLC